MPIFGWLLHWLAPQPSSPSHRPSAHPPDWPRRLLMPCLVSFSCPPRLVAPPPRWPCHLLSPHAAAATHSHRLPVSSPLRLVGLVVSSHYHKLIRPFSLQCRAAAQRHGMSSCLRLPLCGLLPLSSFSTISPCCLWLAVTLRSPAPWSICVKMGVNHTLNPT
jgi:hypothetical protein